MEGQAPVVEESTTELQPPSDGAGYDDMIEGILAEKTAASLSSVPEEKQHVLAPREYLEENVVPLVLQGFNALVRERPSNPVEYLAVFLLQNNPQRE